MKKFFPSVRKFSRLVLLCAAVFLTGCRLFNENPAEFFADYGTVISVKSVDYSGSYIIQDGVINVSSASFTVTWHLDNPNNYPILQDESLFGLPPLLSFPQGSILSSGSITPSFPDNSTVTVTLAGYSAADGGITQNDISPSVFVYRASDGRPQCSSTIKIRCNSPPPDIQNAVCQMYSDAAGGVNERLVIAFDMPSLPSDVTEFFVTVNSSRHSFAVDSSGNISPAQGESWTVASVPPANMGPTYSGGGSFVTGSGTPYYIITDIDNLSGRSSFSAGLVLKDTWGLCSTEKTVLSHRRKVGMPQVNCTDGTVPQETDQDYGIFTITAPAATPNAVLHFNLTQDSQTGAVQADIYGNTSEKTGSTVFHLLPNTDGSEKTYYLNSAYATLSDYDDSDDAATLISGGTLKIKGSKLADITSNGSSFTYSEDQTGAEYRLISPAGSSLTYEIKNSSGTVVSSKTLSPNLNLTVSLSADTYTVTATAKKDYHIDSDSFTQTVTVKMGIDPLVRYVSSAGNDTTGRGTKSKPYASVEKAVESFDSADINQLDADGNPTHTVYLLDDLNDMGGKIFTSSVNAAAVNIVGLSGGVTGRRVKISCQTTSVEFAVSGSQNFVLKDIDFASASAGLNSVINLQGGKLALENVSIESFTTNQAAVVVNGGNFTVKGSTTITGNTKSSAACNVYLGSAKVITVSDNFTGKLGVTTVSFPSVSSPVTITDGYTAALGIALPSLYFESDAGYTVGTVTSGADTEAALVYTGGGGAITPETPADISFDQTMTLNADGSRIYTITAKDGSTDVTGSVTGWDVKLYQGTVSTGVMSTANVITMDSSFAEGNYIIKISGVYKGTTYTDEISVSK